jgi:hypothetical protein
MVVLGRCCVRDPVRAVPYANQVFIERACRTRWACGNDAGECGGGNIHSIIILDDARRFRESRVPKCPEMKLQQALFSFRFPFRLWRLEPDALPVV